MVVQLVFRKNTRMVVDKDFEEVESLGRQMHLRSSAKKLSGLRVERQLPKTDGVSQSLPREKARVRQFAEDAPAEPLHPNRENGMTAINRPNVVVAMAA